MTGSLGTEPGLDWSLRWVSPAGAPLFCANGHSRPRRDGSLALAPFCAYVVGMHRPTLYLSIATISVTALFVPATAAFYSSILAWVILASIDRHRGEVSRRWQYLGAVLVPALCFLPSMGTLLGP